MSVDPETLRPLSSAQERLWWFGQVAPASMTVPMPMHLRGPLQTQALAQAVRLLVDRHALLRTRFLMQGDAPMQQVLHDVPVEIPVIDLRDVPEADRWRRAQALVTETCERPLDLADPPLLRAHLFQLASDHHLLLVRLPHLVVDEWSRQLLLQEISALYAAAIAGEPAHLPPIETDYAAFALWERAMLSDANTARPLSFWRRYLDGAPPLLELPADHPRPPRRAYAGAWRARHLAAPIAAQVGALARQERVTPFHVLLAAFMMLVHRQTGSSDILVGTPFSRRPDVRYERVIGPFLNSLPIRADLRGAIDFRRLLAHVRARVTATLPHAHVPFEMILDHLQVERDPSYNPLVQLWFIYKPQTAGGASWQGPDVTSMELHETAMPFDITWSVAERDGGLECSCSYDSALYEPETIDRLLDQWSRLLPALLSAPDLPLDAHDCLSDEERRRQLVEWNDTTVRWPMPASVHAAVASAAARDPDAIAIVMDDRRVTYGELRASVTALAHRLRGAGVSADSRVAIIMERSPALVIALLAALEAGGAYLPIDPTAARERITTLLRDADAVCLVTDAAVRPRLPDIDVPIIVADQEPAMAAPPSDGAMHDALLCYVLYTSGTTGQPKGVAVSHAAVMNLLRDYQRALAVTPADAMLAIAPVTFDIATLELFLPLISGARLVLAPAHTAADGRDLLARLTRDDITLLQATPATWRLLLDAGWRRAHPDLRIICGAEPLPAELARSLIAVAGHVWNSYGPTETTIYSTFERVTSADDAITIGRAMANSSTYILDRQLRPVPVGVEGEVYIGGVGLARGYLGQPGLTAAAFRPDPWSPQPGGRMYASGDLGHNIADGRIACHGRRDHQVKVNGRRIELEAIARVMERHPSVRGCVVLVREDERRGRFLTAYVTPATDAAIDRASLREDIGRHLPSYMIPSAIVPIDAFPRTRRGKLDRAALPPPAEGDFRAAFSSTAARTPTEAAVADAWRAVLGDADIGVEDDFFARGGNSLQATRVLLLIRDALGVDLSVQAFFEEPTVAAIAAAADRLRASAAAAPRASTALRLQRGATPRLAPQQENWWLNEHRVGAIHPNNVQFAFHLDGPLHVTALEETLRTLQRRHDAFRTAFIVGDDGMGVPVITPPASADLRLAHVDLSDGGEAAQQDQLRTIAERERNRPFDLTRGTLCRVTLARLGAERHVVIFTTHHLVFDEWSMDIVMREASREYAAQVNGGPAALPDLPFQYVDFAAWQRAWLDGAEAAAQMAYWRARLAAPLPPLLPDAPAARDIESHGVTVRGRVPFTLDAEAVDAARRLAQATGCTLFSAILAGLEAVLFAHTGQTDLRFGSLIANRGRAGVEGIIGLFTNVVCLRTQLDPAWSMSTLIGAVHATIAEASAHQDLPLEVLARELARDGIPRASLIQAMIVWLAQPPAEAMRFQQLRTSVQREAEADEESVVLVRNALDLRFELAEAASTIQGHVTYNMHQFTGADMRALAHALSRCLLRAAAQPDVTIAAAVAELAQPQRAAAS